MIRKNLRKYIDASRSEDSSMAIPCPAGLAYLPYQKAGIEYAAARGNVLIADEPGLGKTIQAIAVTNLIAERARVLIISPATMKLKWKEEFLKWDVNGRSVSVILKAKDGLPDTDVVIVNYDILRKLRNELHAIQWDIMIADEAHMLKSSKAARTREVFGGIRRNSDKKIIDRIAPIMAIKRIFLTGTPILKKPADLWGLVHSIDPLGLGADWFTYAKRYCALFELKDFTGKHIGWDWSGAGNLEELQKLMRERFMVRRLKSDVLKELPQKRRIVIPIEATGNLKKLVAKEAQTYEAFKNSLKEDENPPSFSDIAKIRKETALAKLPFVIDFIKEKLDEEDKLVVFAHHHEVLDQLAANFKSESVSLDGRTPIVDRKTAVDSFQNDPNIRLFFGGIQAAGVGITLTAAKTAIFAELDWTPAIVSQAEDRQHRIGQKELVTIYHLVLENSIDHRIVETIIKKQEIADKALDNHE